MGGRGGGGGFGRWRWSVRGNFEQGGPSPGQLRFPRGRRSVAIGRPPPFGRPVTLKGLLRESSLAEVFLRSVSFGDASTENPSSSFFLVEMTSKKIPSLFLFFLMKHHTAFYFYTQHFFIYFHIFMSGSRPLLFALSTSSCR